MTYLLNDKQFIAFPTEAPIYRDEDAARASRNAALEGAFCRRSAAHHNAGCGTMRACWRFRGSGSIWYRTKNVVFSFNDEREIDDALPVDQTTRWTSEKRR